jgi:type III secretion protein V
VTDLIHGIRQARNALVANIGLTLPPFEVELDDTLAVDEMRFCAHEVPMVKASVVNRLAVERQALSVEPADGIPGLAERDEQDWIWLAPDDPLLDDPQLERFTATSLILERMKQAMMLSGPQFLGIQESKAILGWLEHNQPELVQAAHHAAVAFLRGAATPGQ